MEKRSSGTRNKVKERKSNVERKRKPKASKFSNTQPNQLASTLLQVGHPSVNALIDQDHRTIVQLPLQAYNLSDSELTTHFRPLRWTASLPVPLVKQCCSERRHGEPITELLRQKTNWLADFRRVKSSYHRWKNSKMKKQRTEEYVPKGVITCAELQKSDPDPHFMGQLGYDSYYTGGSLVPFQYEGKCYLAKTAKADFEDLEFLALKKLHKPSFALAPSTKRSLQYTIDQEGRIFEVLLETQFRFRCAVRKKHSITVLFEAEGGIQQLQSSTVASNSVPFAAACLLPKQTQAIITADYEKKLLLHKFEPNVKCVQNIQLPKLADDDCWTALRSCGSLLICLDRSTICFYDTHSGRLNNQRTFSLSKWVWKCEVASCLEVDQKQRLLFIGTTHKLVVLRIVEPAPFEIKLTLVVIFTHLLKHFPTYIKHAAGPSEDNFLLIGSHLPGNVCICCFEKDDQKTYVTNQLPYLLPNLTDSYRLTRQHGRCVSDVTAIQQRIDACTAGIAILGDPSSGAYYLLQKTSFGDVLQQKLICQMSSAKLKPNASEVMDAIAKWHAELKADSCHLQIFRASDFRSMRQFRSVLANPSVPVEKAALEVNGRKRKPTWQRSVDTLGQFKDILVKPLLDVWGIRTQLPVSKSAAIQTTWGSKRDGDELDFTEKVNSWLTADDDVAFDELISKSEKQEQMQPCPEVKMEESQAFPIESLVPSATIPVPNTTIRSSTKRKYVQGF